MHRYVPPEISVLIEFCQQPLCQSNTDDMTYRDGDWDLGGSPS